MLTPVLVLGPLGPLQGQQPWRGKPAILRGVGALQLPSEDHPLVVRALQRADSPSPQASVLAMLL